MLIQNCQFWYLARWHHGNNVLIILKIYLRQYCPLLTKKEHFKVEYRKIAKTSPAYTKNLQKIFGLIPIQDSII